MIIALTLWRTVKDLFNGRSTCILCSVLSRGPSARQLTPINVSRRKTEVMEYVIINFN